MNINNKNIVKYDVHVHNPLAVDSSYEMIGYVQCKPAPQKELLEYISKSFPPLPLGWVYVATETGTLPSYNSNQSNTMNNITKINSVVAMLQASKANGFIVGSFSESNGLSFSAEPSVHATASLARTEAKRLAGINPGKYYLFLQIRGGEFVQPMPAHTSF